MEYRQLGTSPVNASVITFGAWAIGGWMWGGGFGLRWDVQQGEFFFKSKDNHDR